MIFHKEGNTGKEKSRYGVIFREEGNVGREKSKYSVIFREEGNAGRRRKIEIRKFMRKKG